MALVLADRVKETTTTTGTGTVTLAGAVTGYQSFSAVGNGNTTYYTIAGQGTSEWEVGIGTYTSSGTTLSRTTVLASSNAGSLVSFSSGTKDVFVTYPAEKSVNIDASTNVDLGTNSLNNVSHLGVNTTTVPDILIRAFGDNNSGSRIAVRGYSSDANSSSMRVTKFRGTYAAPQAPQSGDSLGKFEIGGYGTTSSSGYPQASLEGLATEAWGATARGTKAVIKVTPNTTTTQVTALTINQDSTAVFANTVTANGTLLTGNTGTVTSASVTSANGFAGTVATATTTPAITISTSVTGILKGNATAISAATSGTDYAPGTSGNTSGLVYSTTTTGALSTATGAQISTALGSTAITGNAANVTGIVVGANGGTGVANTGSTITVGGNLNHAGAFTQTFTATANTSLTLPTSGTLISTVTNMAANPVTGTPSSSTYLRGDGTWASVSATNLAGGALGSVPYQLLSGSTTFLAGNTTTTPQFLTSTGVAGIATAPTYTSSTGSGNVVLATSPTLVTPALGTPSAIVLTNATSVPVNQATGTLAVANGGTGSTTSTGSGSVVLATSPTITTPVIDKINTSITNVSLGAGNASSFKNKLINGAMVINQRGTSLSTNNSQGYYIDRIWGFSSTVAATFSQGSSSGLAGFPNYARSQRNSGAVGGAYYTGQIIESNNLQDLQGQSVTISFWARCGANYSPTSSILVVYLNTGTTADQGLNQLIAGWTGVVTQTANVTLTTSWQRFSVTFTVGSTVQEISPFFAANAVGVAGANDYFDITGFQLEVNTQMTGFDFRPYGTELNLCQRYYAKILDPACRGVGTGGTSGGASRLNLIFPVTMRTYPSAGFSGSFSFWNGASTATWTGATPSVFGGVSLNQLDFDMTVTASFPQGDAVCMYTTGSNGTITLSSEL